MTHFLTDVIRYEKTFFEKKLKKKEKGIDKGKKSGIIDELSRGAVVDTENFGKR